MSATSHRPLLRFHAAGNWSRHEVAVDRTASTSRPPAEVHEHVERAWAEATARPGVNLFDGAMCRLESWDASPASLRLVLSDTTYKAFLGTNLTRPDFADAHGQAALANPVGVSPALLTADGFLMMGRRNASVAYYPQRVHPFAGALDPGDADPFEAILRELNEELGFEAADVTDVRCTGIAEDLSIRQPELIFFAATPRTRAEVEAALDRTEHHDSWHVRATEEAVTAVVSTPEQAFTPVAIASLLLWGRTAFGEQWYRAASAPFAG